MKKLVLLAMVVFSFVTYTKAQINFSPKVRVAEGGTDDKSIIAVITNATSNADDSLLKWKIIEYSMPAEWVFTFCDTKDCLSGLGKDSSNVFILGKGKSFGLKADFILNGKEGNALVKLVLSYANRSDFSDTLTLMASTSVGLKNSAKKQEASIYPNPAKDNLVLKYQVNKPVEVAIYNVLGSKVSSFIHQGAETTINTSNLQKGMYFIRFSDNGRLISKPFHVTE